MQKLRSIHLYLGCVFAPMLLFFAVSGIWQTLGLGGGKTLAPLTTIHTGRALKTGGLYLSNSLMMCFVLLMAGSFIVTTLLGVMMAIKYGRSRTAAYSCLLLGVLIPFVLVLISLSA